MRVISLLPAATEMIGALGALAHLVGVTHECDHPQVVRSRMRVTRSAIQATDAPRAIDEAVRERSASGAPIFELLEDRIAALHPDLLITQALCEVCAVSEADVRALASRLSPPPRVMTLGGTSLDGVMEDIVTVAGALDLGDEAEELLTGLNARMRLVHETLKAAKAPRPRVALLEWTDPIFVAGHWGPEQIRRAGGVDVLGTAGAHSHVVTAEQVAAADPQIVIIAPCGYSLERAVDEGKRLLDDPAWSWLEGRAVWTMDANGLVSRPGPRLVDGIEAMARIFNPSPFSPLDPAHAQRLA